MINLSKIHLDRPVFQPGSLKACLVAVLIVAFATALRLQFGTSDGSIPFVVFFPAVITVTFICGSAAGILASLLSVVSAWVFILPPEISALAIYQTSIFGVGAVTMTAVVGAMRAATANVQRLNETLRISEEKFRGLLESAPDAMVIIDENRRIVLINARTEALFGHRRAELLGKPIEMLLPEPGREDYAVRLAAFMTGASGTEADRLIDLHGLRKDGTEFPIEVSLGQLQTEAGTLVSCAVRDATQRKQIEANLAAASKSKSDFLASMSHELRTPLNAIIGFSEMMRDALMGPLSAQYRDYAADINESGRHLHDIINDILDISKVEGGRLELHDEAVSIGETAEACRRIVAAMAESAGVSLSIDAPASLPLIRTDKLRFKQILLNLMSNAVKFTPAGGHASVSAWIEADGAVIAVNDTGIGMRAEDIVIALEPFRQIDGALSRRFDGTGLGLPLAKALVELHGGILDIQSAPNAGTTVRIRLPLERVVNAAA